MATIITVAQYFEYIEQTEKWLKEITPISMKDRKEFSATTVVIPITGITPLVVYKFNLFRSNLITSNMII